MSYKTPKGKDESLVDLPLKYAEYEGRLTAHKWRNGIVIKGGNWTTDFLDELSHRLNTNQSVVINIVGPPGSGKTYFAITLAQLFDPKFNIRDAPAPDPKHDMGQLCFERDHIRHLIGENSPLKRGQAIVLDEAHFGMGSRTFQQTEQVDMVNLISTIRSKGFLLIMVSLHSNMLDKTPREYIINYRLAMKARGEAKPYFLWMPTHSNKQFKKGKSELTLPLPDSYSPTTGIGCDYSDCLKGPCKGITETGYERCFTIRAIYERRKDEFINKMSKGTPTTTKPTKATTTQQVEKIHENAHRLYLTDERTNRISTVITKTILTENEYADGDNSVRHRRNEYEKAHPDILKWLIDNNIRTR